MSFITTAALFFITDAPLFESTGKTRPSLSMSLVITTTFLVHVYHRNKHRLALEIPKSGMGIKRVQSQQIVDNYRDSAKEKLLEVDRALRTLDNKWISSAFLNMFVLPLVLRLEETIYRVFTDANKDELNYLVCIYYSLVFVLFIMLINLLLFCSLGDELFHGKNIL